MFKYTIVVLSALIASSMGKPLVLDALHAPVVTATSSQVISRNYNGIAAAPVIAGYTAPVAAAAAYTAAPVVAAARYAAPAVAAARYSAPYTFAASSPLIASPYVASAAAPYTAVSSFNYAAPYTTAAYSAPLQYAAAAPYLL